MSAQHIQILRPIPLTAPRGAVWAGQAAVWAGRTLRGAGVALWKALEENGQRRAARELLNIAQRWDSIDPDLARTLRVSASALVASLGHPTPQHTIKEIK